MSNDLYRHDAEMELHTDATKWGFGAILLQWAQNDNQQHTVYQIFVHPAVDEVMDGMLPRLRQA